MSLIRILGLIRISKNSDFAFSTMGVQLNPVITNVKGCYSGCRLDLEIWENFYLEY